MVTAAETNDRQLRASHRRPTCTTMLIETRANGAANPAALGTPSAK
jgi:hypothetical protein